MIFSGKCTSVAIVFLRKGSQEETDDGRSTIVTVHVRVKMLGLHRLNYNAIALFIQCVRLERCCVAMRKHVSYRNGSVMETKTVIMAGTKTAVVSS